MLRADLETRHALAPARQNRITAMDSELKRKLAAILVADVVGYSRLVADDEEATLRRLEVFRALWQDCVVRYGGRIFNTAGDSVLAEFPSAVEAVRCALEFQGQAKTHNDGLVPKRQMHFRIGITIGDVVQRGGDLLGDGVNIAARLQTLAGHGGICVSSWVRESVANKLQVQFKDLGDQSVKNIPTPIRAYAVSALDERAPATADAATSRNWSGRMFSSWQGLAIAACVAVAGVAASWQLARHLQTAKPIPPAERAASPADAMRNSDPAAKSTAQPAAVAAAPLPAKPAPEPAKATAATPPDAAPRATPAAAVALHALDPLVRRGMLTAAAESGLKPGDRFKECDTCPEMIVLPRGDFIMGSSADQPGHEKDETPVRKVTIAARIAMARYAITLEEYSTFAAVTGYRPGAGCRVHEGGKWVDRAELSFRGPGFIQDGTHPVVCVNWNDAKAYTDWMTARIGREYRLPSEAEREFATRAGTTTAFWWGNDIAPANAGYDWSHAFGTGPRGQTRRGTHPAAAFDANPWGLFQMHGNVSEWVEDCWNASYRSAPTDGAAWVTGDCRRRVLRGGSWGYAPKDLRSSYREGATLTNRNFNFGFRVVRVLR